MTFGAPGYLSLLLLSVPIVLLHMVRARRRKVVVPSTLLWRLASRDVATTRAFRRFLPSLLLLLQLLTLACIALALARPSTSVFDGSAGLTVVVVDSSASMQATDIGGGRLGAAISMAEGRMKGKAAFTVIRAAGEPDVVAQRVDRRSALKAMRAVKPWWGTCDLGAAVSLGEGLLRGKGDMLLVITDNAGLRLSPPPAGAVSQVVAVAPQGGNVGIASLESRVDPTLKGSYRWLAVLRNYSSARAEVTATLEIDGSRLYSSRVTIAPGASAVLPTTPSEVGSVVRLADGSPPARATLTIRPTGETQDFLAVDDTMRIVIHPRRLVRVAVVRASGQAAESPILAALSLMSDARISVYGRSAAPAAGATDLTIYEGFSPSKPALGKVVIVGALPSYLSAGGSPVTAPVEAVDWDKTSQLLRFVDLGGLAFGGAIRHGTLPGATVLAESPEGPLIEELRARRGTTLVMSFKPEASDLIGQAAFPILMANLVSWAEQPEGPLASQSVVAGDIVDLRGVEGSEAEGDPVLTDPGGRRLPGAAIWQVSEPGVHMFEDGAAQLPIAVNFADEAEADIIHPKAAGNMRATVRVAGGAGPTPTVASNIWRLLLLLGTTLILVEWLGFTSGRLGRFSATSLWRQRRGTRL